MILAINLSNFQRISGNITGINFRLIEGIGAGNGDAAAAST